MAAFGRRHAVCAVSLAIEMRHPQAGTGAEHAQPARRCQRFVGAGQVDELVLVDTRDRMGDRFEIVDDAVLFDAQLFPDQCRANDPGIVGKADDFAADRARDRHRHARRQGSAHPAAKILPRRLKAGVILGMQRFRFAQADRAVVGNGCNGEACVCAPDVDADQFHCHRPAIAIIEDAPCSAPSALLRNMANSSRPIPVSGSGAGAGSRASRSASVES